MRITNNMMVSQFLTDANGSLNRLSNAQQQVNSTRRVNNISEDPQAVMQALKARNKLTSIDEYQGNIKTVTSYLKEAESSVSELDEILQTVYERVTSAATGGKNQDNLNVIAEELTQLQKEFISVGNSTISTSYIFGGHNYTGTTDGVNSTPPFSVNPANGNLIYNGVDLSQISWAAEFEANTRLITQSEGFAQKLNPATDLSGSTDAYARDTQCSNALVTLSSLISAGNSALAAAKAFGLDTNAGSEYAELNKLINGEGEEGEPGFVPGLTHYRDQLHSEISKELEENLDSGSASLAFDKHAAQTILNNVASVCGSLGTAVSDLQGEIDGTTSYVDGKALLDAEENKGSSLYIGPTQTSQFAFSGTDLLGAGTNNVYFILDKCISMVKNGDTAGLSGMIGDLQSAQSRVLCFQTNIGATMNTMELIGSRYTSSTLNYKEMQSDAIDADMAEAYTNFTTAKTVYSAALAAGAEIVQISLLDFLK